VARSDGVCQPGTRSPTGGRARPRPQRRLGDRHRERSKASRRVPVGGPSPCHDSQRRQRDLPAHLINSIHDKT